MILRTINCLKIITQTQPRSSRALHLKAEAINMIQFIFPKIQPLEGTMGFLLILSNKQIVLNKLMAEQQTMIHMLIHHVVHSHSQKWRPSQSVKC